MTSKASNQESEISHEEFILNDGRSIINFLSTGLSPCGYCDDKKSRKGETSSDSDIGGRKSNNLIAFKLNSDDYQALLDRGWRRSGTFCYHPINTEACCPNYPVICKALEFQFSRTKRKCIENINNYLFTGYSHSFNDDDCDEKKNNDIFPKLDYSKQSVETEKFNNKQQNEEMIVKSRYDKKTFNELSSSTKAKDKRFVKSCQRKVKLYNISIEEAIKRTRNRANQRGKGTNFMRPSLESYLYPHKSILIDSNKEKFKPKHKLEIRMNHVDSEVSRSLRDAEHEILIKYQDAIHHEPESEWTLERFINFLVDTPLFVEPIEPEKYDFIEKPDGGDSDDTYSKKVYDYQDDEYLIIKPPNLPTAYGTYHCTYHLDDKLIACGVLDVLPKCITTVYFFYDPKYSKLNLGYYSALVEISMIRQMAKHYCGDKNNFLHSSIVDYYIGYYVHECKKMHYKVRFEPSYLLCSETAQYEPTRECLKKLKSQGKKYVRFSSKEVPNAYEFKPSMDEILKIPISLDIFKNNSLDIKDYLQWLEKNLGPEYGPAFLYNYIEPYAKLVGPDLLPKIILKLHSIHQGLLRRYLLVTENRTKSKK